MTAATRTTVPAAAPPARAAPVPQSSPPLVSPSTLPPEDASKVEVSMIEAGDFTGVTFTPELWVQRRHWALQVLRDAGVKSVLDIGCGPGSLLQTLVVPPPTIAEPPIVGEDGSVAGGRELFLKRVAAIDIDPAVISSAMATLTPPGEDGKSALSLAPPRWETMDTELWLGNIELYNEHLEGYEAIVALEVIEHLEPQLLSRFGVVTLGTYRPRLLLVSTPNFDFNSKFPDHRHDECGKRGFVDPTGRTDRVFRHSDHKCEMTSDEFRQWAIGAAADWGYSVEIGGVGVSSKPSFYPATDERPSRPIYATQTAVFRMTTGVPMRSPRSVRTVDLPFMLGASEAAHPHRLAAKMRHPTTMQKSKGAPFSPDGVVGVIDEAFGTVATNELTLSELWGMRNVAAACAGSKRYLVACLGGWGDVPPARERTDVYEVLGDKTGLVIVRRG